MKIDDGRPALASLIPPSWLERLSDGGVFDEKLVKLDTFLRAERVEHNVYPPQQLTFAALRHTAFSELNVVILGQDPYHGKGQANGLAFSVGSGVKIPPSLRNIYKELHADIGCPIPDSGELESWAEQGVLLLNTSLSVREKAAGSHAKKGWTQITDRMIEVISQREEPCVFILWGSHARKKAEMISSHHVVIQSAHPSPLSAHRGFWGSKPFSKTNEALRRIGRGEIDWALD